MNPRDDGLAARLKSLPIFDPPSGGWLALERRRRRDNLRRNAGWAMAASVTLAVIVGGWQLRQGATDAGSAPTTVAALESQSQQLEKVLQRSRQQTVVWDGDRAQRSAELESQLALVDLQIGYADSKSTDELWRDRLSLMNALVETHQGDDASTGDTEFVEY